MIDTLEVNRRLVIAGGLSVLSSSAVGQVGFAGADWNVRDFGAVGDGVADDAPAFQRAIDAAARTGGTVTFGPGVYLLHCRPAEDGDGITAITLRSGVTLQGTDRERCVLKLADGQIGPGTYARVVASRGDVALVGLHRFSLDGNRTGQGRFGDDINSAAILLGWKGRCADVTIEAITVRGAAGQAIMVEGSIGNPSRNIRIAHNLVERASFIGIQCSQFEGVTIVGNRIDDCGNNAIDVYGDDTIGQSIKSTSRGAIIVGNEVHRCSVGVFLETVEDCVASDNEIYDCTSDGVRVNRIHGEPRNLKVERNRIDGALTGIAVGGETGGVIIRGNFIRNFRNAGLMFYYNTSNITISDNHFLPNNINTPIILGKPVRFGTIPEEFLGDIQAQGNHIPKNHEKTKIFVNQYRRSVRVVINNFVKDENK